MSLPDGTVTFLFTDIEGSTRRWEELGSAMEPVIEAHDRLLGAVVEEHRGRVVKGLGDGLMAAFASATDAVCAAAEAQRALASAEWGPAPDLRVRMGLHTADANPVDGDYHAPGVNRAARIAAAAHGGQVLVSATTAALLDAPPGITTRALGPHQLRDLREAVEIHQVQATWLDTDFPPIRSLGTVDHNLPAQRTSFVGRDHELADVVDALRSDRMVTLVGLGGIGKTRLALQAAAEVAHRHRTVRLVELVSLGADADVAASVRASLPWSGPEHAPSNIEAMAVTIGTRDLLLVLDNCEHVLSSVVELVDACLSRCPGLSVLATSREPLGVPGERIRPLAPLAFDGVGPEPPPAIRLFLDRARSVGAHVDDSAVADVAAVCRSVDGIPLGVELAAARASHLSPAEIAARLDSRLEFLSARDRTTAARHRTLGAVLDWSHDLLRPAEQALLRRTAVFVGPASLETLEAVTPGDVLDPTEVLDAAAVLVEHSLLTVDTGGASTRYALLETVRRYALERLEEAGEETAARARHAAWCVDRLEQAGSISELAAPERMEAIAGLRWASHAQDPHALALAANCWQWWELTGRPEEGRCLLEDVLVRFPDAAPARRAEVRSGAAQLALVAGDLDRAATLHAQNLEELEALGDREQMARARNSLGVVQLYRGDLAGARSLVEVALEESDAAGDTVGSAYARSALGLVAAAEGAADGATTHLLESLKLLRRAGKSRDAASVLTNLGNIAQDQGDLQRAHRFFEGALQLQREVGDDRGVATSWNNLSIIAQLRGDDDHADEYAEAALGIFDHLGDAPGAAATVNNLANFAAERGHDQQAYARYRDAVERFRDLRNAKGTATALANLAALAIRCGEARLAWRCAVESLALDRALGGATGRSAVATLQTVSARCGLTGAAEVEGFASGAVTPSDTVLEALRAVDVPLHAPALEAEPTEAGGHELTRRETQVAGLVARGATNAEIAAELFISERTVESHMNHIRTKLDIGSRTQLVRWALDHGVG